MEAAKCYSCHVKPIIEDTLSEMESRWFDDSHTLTEAEKMVLDYNNGDCTLSQDCSTAAADIGMSM